MAANLVAQHMGQDLPQPREQLGLRLAAEFGQIAIRFQHRLLTDVGRIEFALKLAIDLQPSEEPQPRLKRFQKLCPRRLVAVALGTEQLDQVRGLNVG
jgi:hypothetical protein